MTESEAKTKWCPLVRMGEGAHNRWSSETDTIGLVGCECVASACMMWRNENQNTTDGFCGLAGND